jgi:hypothetical protein
VQYGGIDTAHWRSLVNYSAGLHIEGTMLTDKPLSYGLQMRDMAKIFP